jgi:tRNA (cytidine/uridine-2'-O-)-methyltransferase
LVNPQIPQNTGNISRLCAGTNTHLHLVKPFGFSLEDRYLKRAGLDYWPHVKLHLHDSLDEVIGGAASGDVAFLSRHASRTYTDFLPTGDPWLVFGSETSGLSAAIKERERARERLYGIPINGNVRSFNLANSVAITLFEVLRQRSFPVAAPAGQ